MKGDNMSSTVSVDPIESLIKVIQMLPADRPDLMLAMQPALKDVASTMFERAVIKDILRLRKMSHEDGQDRSKLIETHLRTLENIV